MKKIILTLFVAALALSCKKEECHVCTITIYPDNVSTSDSYCGTDEEYAKYKTQYYNNCNQQNQLYPDQNIVCNCD